MGKEKRESKRKNTMNRVGKAMQRELEWIKHGAKTKARERKVEELQKNFEEAKASKDTYNPTMLIPEGPKLGGEVIEFLDCTLQMDDGRVLFKNLSLKIPEGSVVGIVGPNGAGKTSILKCN